MSIQICNGGLVLALLLGAAAAGPAQAQARAPGGSNAAVPHPCDAPVNRNEPDPIEALGCATETNLRAMVANPVDLERGAPAGPPAGDAALAAVHRHRLGQVKPLANEGGGADKPAANSSSR